MNIKIQSQDKLHSQLASIPNNLQYSHQHQHQHQNPDNIPASIASFNRHGIKRTQLAALLINLFQFPERYADCLESYYLLQWTGSHFSTKLTIMGIRHQDKDYAVVYHKCTPSSARKAKQVRLSFRSPRTEFNLVNYVLVSIHIDADGISEET